MLGVKLGCAVAGNAVGVCGNDGTWVGEGGLTGVGDGGVLGKVGYWGLNMVLVVLLKLEL